MTTPIKEIRLKGCSFIDGYPDNLLDLAQECHVRVEVKHDRNNPVDPNARAVYFNGQKVGHLPKEHAAAIATLDSAWAFHFAEATIHINPDNPDHPGASIVAWREPAEEWTIY